MNQEKTTLEKIAAAVDWYRNRPVDYADIETLTAAHKGLACALFDYAGEVGDLYKASKGAEYARKIAVEREKTRLIGEGKSAVSAKSEAESAADRMLFDEAIADGDYRAAVLQLQAAKDVLDAMFQHIASLKQEKRLTMYGAAQA